MRTQAQATRVRLGAARRTARHHRDELKFRRRYGFAPPPPWADLTGYDPMLDTLRERGLLTVPGDVLEIGVLLGGGTYKLSQLLVREAPMKRVIAVDVFDPDFDQTECLQGVSMADFYRSYFDEVGADRDQRSVYDEVTAGCSNIVTLAEDSATVALPTEALCFAFVDGNHSAEYVRGDFEKVWGLLSPGGIVAIHDYGHDIPQVTHTITAVLGERPTEVARTWVDKITLFVQRER